MRSLILSIIFMAFAVISYAQTSELCATAEGAPVALTPSPSVATTLTIDPTWITNSEGYTPTNLGGGFATAYWSFTVDATGFYSINIEGAPASPAIGSDISVSLNETCVDLASGSEIFTDILPADGAPETATCTSLAAGTTYTIAMAIDPANAGDIVITIVDAPGATNIDCASASPMAVGTNSGNNSCSGGLVWYSYTVVNGGDVSITASMSSGGNDISTPVITQSSIDGCTTFDGTTSWTCLPVGTVISFEAGDDTAPFEQGDFNIDIVDDASLIANEVCDDVIATPVTAPSCEPTILTATDNTTVGACPDFFTDCITFETESTVWYAFTTDADVQTLDIEIINGTISGTEFALIDATSLCPTSGSPATAIGGCQTGGMLIDQVVSPNTTYFIAVSTESGGTDGDFTLTVTPQNPPTNDDCAALPADADITSTAAAGVDGSTGCASGDLLDFCASVTEDHVVYYTYTVDATILVNRTVTITTTGATAPIFGSDATSLGFGIFSDCAGTPVTMSSGAQLLPLAGSDLCDPLGAPIVFECVEPGTSFTIAVASTEGMEGDFNIMITEMATGTASNDICDLGTNPDILTTATGTNFCADGEITFCGMTTTDDHQVWYQYTNTTGVNVDLEVTFGATGTATSATDLSMIVFSDICGTNVVFPGTPTTGFCNILDAPTTISCIEDGETIRILVGSAEDATVMGPEGDFTIATTEISNSPANDECTGAVDITPPTCEWVVASTLTPLVSAENACPEDFAVFPAGCDFTTESTVWFSITVPNDGERYTLDFRNISDDAFLSIFESTGGDCDTYGTPSINSDCETGNGPHGALYDDLTNGSTYFIAVGDPTEVGGFDFEIRLNLVPSNDDCDMAEMLTASTTAMGTTSCATTPPGGEYNSIVCTDDDETNTVFYEYTVPDGDKGFHVTITAGATEPFMGDLNLVVFETDSGTCDTGSGAEAVDEVCTSSAVLNEEFECVGPGTYIIRIATSEDNAGMFDIIIEPQTSVQPNDFCDMPDLTEFAAMLECEWMVIDAVTEEACPEHMNLDPTDCGFDDFPVTWYSVTAPANAEFLDLQINFGGSNPFIGVFEIPSPADDCENISYVAGTTCYTGPFTQLEAPGLGQDLVDITPGNTYLIGVGSQIDAGTTVNFGIKWITPPDNDECDMAEVLNPTPSGGPGESSVTLIEETTQCATEPVTGTACDEDKTNTVWYTYQVEPNVKEITIDIANWVNTVATGVPDFSVAVYDGCPTGGGFLTQPDGSNADYCGGEGVDLITLSCLDEGDIITILVSSSSENEGMFDITLNTLEPICSYTNDLCADASPLTGNPDPLVTDDTNDCILVAGCNDLACAEVPFDVIAECGGINLLNTVFYTFMTDGDVDPTDGAFVNIEITNGEAGELDSPGAILFDGDCTTAVVGACASGAGGEYNSGPLGGPGLIQPNTQYTIMIFNADDTQNGGTFDLCVTVSSGCVNDICDESFTLEPNITIDNPASTNSCTPDIDVAGCGGEFEEATLWYQVVIPEGFTGFEVTLINEVGSDGVGDGSGEVSIAVGPLEDCADVVAADVLYTDCTGFGTGVHTVDCAVEFGTYYIQIGSADMMDAGDFTITFTPINDPGQANDLCTEAEELTLTPECMFELFPGDLNRACPELNDFGACMFTENPAVWYKFTIPVNDPPVASMDVLLEGLGSPMYAIFQYDCTVAGMPGMDGVTSIPTDINGANTDCIQMEMTEGVTIEEGEEYYILVSSATGEETPFDLSIRLNVPPINDDPCTTSDNPPLDMTGGGSHAGTTCCARGPKDLEPDGTGDDWPNQAPCNDLTEDAAVWYVFTPDPNDDGYDIVVNGATISNQMTVQVYGVADPTSFCTTSPTANDVVASSCSDLAVNLRIPNCDPTLTYFVKVTTSDADCGEFNIDITPAAVCEYADTCDEAVDPLLTMTQESCSDPLEYIMVPGCLDLACPDPAINNCMQMMGPTVWFKINIDDPEATKLITQVDAPGFDAVWAVFQGTTCDDMVPLAEQLVVDGTTQTFPCSNSDNEPANLFQTPIDPAAVADGLMYWVSVTALGEITDPEFTLSYNSALPCLACSGDDAVDCNNGEFTASVLDEFGNWEEVEDDFQFCQGIDVQVCLEFNYNTTGSGNDWFHGFVPVFGPGWDVDDAILAGISPGPNFEFFGATGGCAPILNGYDLPNVCTYEEEGVLKLCNSACDATCPCSGGMQDGDPLPSGWWYNSPGGLATCGTFGCSPASFFGWPGGTNVDVELCLELRTKEFDSVEECEEKKSLQIIVQTFSDAISGCWVDSNPCVVDPSFQGPTWEMECNVPPPAVAEDAEICNEGTLGILVQTADGSPTQIQVDVIENFEVDGENSFTFDGGSGIIDDQLTNNSNVTQIVEYVIYSVDPNLLCPGVLDTIEVTIYAQLVVDFNPVYVCDGGCTDITPDFIEGGAGMPYTYEWNTGEVSESINVCPLVPTTYFVTVTDNLGCTGEGEVEVDVKPPVELSWISDDPLLICQDGLFDPFFPDFLAEISFDNGSPDYTVDWTADPGLIGFDGPGFSFPVGTWIVDEESSTPGTYQLCGDVTDFFGCMETICKEVIIGGEINITTEIIGLECGVNEATIRVSAIDASGNNVTMFNLFGGCPEEDFITDGFGVVANFLITEANLINYSCYTIEAVTDAGCVARTEVTLEIPQGTPIEISGTENICEGDEATITITNSAVYGAGAVYTWTPPELGDTPEVTFTPTSTQTYFVSVLDDLGCLSDTSFTVNVNPDPIIGLSGTTTFCSGGTATITATGGTVYDWTGTGTINGNSYTADAAETVTLEVISDFGCVSDTTITFTEESVISVNIGGPNLCDGESDTLFVVGSFDSYSWTFNAAVVGDTSFLVVTEPGTYMIDVVDITGCPGTGSIDILNATTPVAEVTDSITVCNEDSGVGPVIANFDDQVTGDAGTWRQLDAVAITFDPADVSAVDFTGIAPGCYAFVYETMSAVAPCMNTADTMYVCVEACPCPSPATSAIPDLCNNDTYDLTDSQVTTEPGTWQVLTGPAPDLAILITGSTFGVDGMEPGTYELEFTLDAPGNSPPCEVSSTQMVTVFPALVITALPGRMCNIPGQADPDVLDLYTLISLDATDGGTWAQVGTPAVTITGSTIMGSEVTDLPADLTFTYTSSDPDGPCGPETIEVTVQVNDCNCIFVGVGMDTLCNDGAVLNLNDLLENPENLSGTWSSTSGTVTGSMFDPTGLGSGIYEIIYTLTESAGDGCPEEYPGSILIRKKPEITLATGLQPCSMDTGNGPTEIDLYGWLDALNTSDGSWTQTGGSPMLTFTDDGTTALVDFKDLPNFSEFQFTYTTSAADDPCTEVSETITITVQDCDCPPLMLGQLDPVCNNGGPVDLTLLADGSANGVYTFFNAANDDLSAQITGGNMIDVTGLAAGTYTVVYTLVPAPSGNCTASMSRELVIENYEEIEGATTANVCSDPDGNDPTTLNFFELVPNSVFSNWVDLDGSGVDLSSNTALTSVSFVTVTPPGDYRFEYTVDNVEPCEDYVHILTVTVTDDCNCPTIVPLMPADECNTDGPIDLTQYDDVLNAGSWSSTELTVNGGNSLVVDGVAAGTYTLTYTITNPLPDCPETADVMILIGEPANPGTALEAFEVCEGEAVVVILDDRLEGEDTGGTWTESSGSTGFSGNMFDTDGLDDGTYTFTYTLSNNEPCTDASESVTVIINPNPAADAGGDKFIDCTNSTADIGVAGTDPNLSYSWSLAGEEIGTTAILTVSNGGVYELTVINSVTLCQSIDIVEVIKSDDLVTMDVEVTQISCNGEDDGFITLTNQEGGDENYMYSLNGGASTTDANSFNSLPAGDYIINIADGAGCDQDYSFTIIEPAAISVEIAGDEIIRGEPGDEFTLTIDPVGSTVDSIVWSDFNDPTTIFCNGGVEECTSITILPINTTSQVYVEVFDANGCSANDQVQIQLQRISDVVFPNIITPNGDNSNDRFFIASDDVETVLNMQIFDRWGELIWERQDFAPRDPSLGWDGKFNDEKVVPGVYVFTVEVLYNDPDATRETFSGDVTVTDSE